MHLRFYHGSKPSTSVDHKNARNSGDDDDDDDDQRMKLGALTHLSCCLHWLHAHDCAVLSLCATGKVSLVNFNPSWQ